MPIPAFLLLLAFCGPIFLLSHSPTIIIGEEFVVSGASQNTTQSLLTLLVNLPFELSVIPFGVKLNDIN